MGIELVLESFTFMLKIGGFSLPQRNDTEFPLRRLTSHNALHEIFAGYYNGDTKHVSFLSSVKKLQRFYHVKADSTYSKHFTLRG
jgi:hypothetical protein